MPVRIDSTHGDRAAVPTENSIALKKRERHPRGREGANSSDSESTCRIAELLNDPPCRLPEQITAAGSVYILKRKGLLKLPVVHIVW